MAFSDYTSALSTLRTHIASQDWDSARDQVLTCRAWLASLVEGGGDGKTLRYDAATKELDALEREIKARQAAGNSPNRLGRARTSYR